MHPHEALIERFYAAFAARDGAAMAACYHRDLVFSDPAFGTLTADQAGAMWRMLCAKAADLEISVSEVRADDATGSASWDARYTFSRTRRPVHNQISAAFRFREHLIVSHIDRFSFWRWSRQALGLSGWLLGWSPWLQQRVRRSALEGLNGYVERERANRSAPKAE
ncbi:MAG: nuclear transport factor 2 family protein [Gemmatimonadales bacterium]